MDEHRPVSNYPNFNVTFLLRNGREVTTLVTFEHHQDPDIRDEDDISDWIEESIEDRQSPWKTIGNCTLMFSQIDGWVVRDLGGYRSPR